ncbi:hypothetical protein AVBRAN12654_07425 [Campylobacter sp. RM12654]|uniref:hypothetical protein n=1 Tax=Campylobacter sp. RM12654 TaxID=2735738 RepID=UPI0030152393|nr:hypothetical protein [Campylobacter sp. RM12654]
MIYSLKNAEQKPILNKFNKLCFYFLIFIIFVIIFFAVFIKIKQELAYSDAQQAKENSDKMVELIGKNRNEIILNKEYIALVSDIQASNINLKKSIKNLFDLVPDSIVLNEVLMEQKSLLIKGITPTKEIYNNLLQTPLQSIFETSKTNFIQLNSGWYNFVSINTIENSEGFNE